MRVDQRKDPDEERRVAAHQAAQPAWLLSGEPAAARAHAALQPSSSSWNLPAPEPGARHPPDQRVARGVSGIAHKRPSIRCVGASSRAIGTPCAHALAHGLAAQVRHGAAPGPSRAYSSRASVRSP
jgi:hypothetical protein